MATPGVPPHRDRRLPPVAGRRTAYLRARRLRHRRQRATALVLFLVAAAMLGADLAHGQAEDRPLGGSPAVSGPGGSAGPEAVSGAVAGSAAVGTAGARSGAALVGVRPGDGGQADNSQGDGDQRAGTSDGAAGASPAGAGTASYPMTGPGSFDYAGGTGPMLGGSGPPRRYRVAVEERVGQDAADFAAQVDAILGDRQGWTASGQLRLQRVPSPGAADFTVLLATPATSERMCAAGGLHTERYTSCRLPGQVIVNLARWLTAVPGYGAPLAVYRAYAINHEVGHELGHGHEACPGGGPAPVMQQQTYGLRGCTANGWPYLGGRRHSGRPVP